MNKKTQTDPSIYSDPDLSVTEPMTSPQEVEEIGGRKGQEPTRYGDWEKNGRCVDF